VSKEVKIRTAGRSEVKLSYEPEGMKGLWSVGSEGSGGSIF